MNDHERVQNGAQTRKVGVYGHRRTEWLITDAENAINVFEWQ